MAGRRKPKLKTQVRKLKRRMPDPAAAATGWLENSSVWLRWPVAIVLIVAGCFGFLPVLGFWMIPLGLILIAQDVPFIRAPLARLFAYVARKWPA
jgi:hypothetical protein